MTPDDVVADEPTEGAADQHIGGEVILTKNAGEADASGPGVEQNWVQWEGYSAASADAAEKAMSVWDEGNEESTPALDWKNFPLALS